MTYESAKEVAEDIDVDPSRVLSAEEAAEAMSLTPPTVYARGRKGKLDTYETLDHRVFVVPPEAVGLEPEPGPDVDELKDELADAEAYIDQIEEQLADAKERLSLVDRDNPVDFLEEKLDLERGRRKAAEDEVVSLQNRVSLLKSSGEDTAVAELDELKEQVGSLQSERDDLKEKYEEARAKIHSLNNQLSAGIGTLWCEFCEAGPLNESAFNDCEISEIAAMCADAFHAIQTERDELKQKIAAQKYVDEHQSHPVAKAVLGGIRSVASRFIR